MKRKIYTKQHEKALNVAKDLVAQVPLREVYDVMVSMLDYDQYR